MCFVSPTTFLGSDLLSKPLSECKRHELEIFKTILNLIEISELTFHPAVGQ